jgi:deoxyribonuclease-4
MARIGAHVNGGIKGGVGRAIEIQAEAIQIFVGSPQTWRPANPAPADVEKFRADVATAHVAPVFVHGIYLINLAAERPDVYAKSVAALTNQVTWASRVGAAGLIFHPGSAGSAPYDEALARLIGGLERVLTEAEGPARVVLEVCAGQGQTIGVRFQQLADIIAGLGGDPRLAVCWDTCHLYSAGYDIASADGLERTLEEMDQVLGLDRLVAIHANDSKAPLGANLDRHENIGQGSLGEEAFGRLLNHPALQDQPFLLEVPGFDGNGPDLRNIATLRRLAGRPLAELVELPSPLPVAAALTSHE